MARIEKFEDLVAWQQGRALVREVYAISDRPPFSRDFVMRNQIRGAALSVPNNIAEGFERASHGEFHRFLTYAKGSCGEVRSQLYNALDVGHIDSPRFETMLAKTKECGRVIGGLRRSIERARKPQHSSPGTQQS